MDYIWTPWRYQYITNAIAGEKPECIFCDAAKHTDDATTLVVHRGVSSFAILNRFPYTSGHLMIVPYKHTAEISGVDAATQSPSRGRPGPARRFSSRPRRRIRSPRPSAAGPRAPVAGATRRGSVQIALQTRWHEFRHEPRPCCRRRHRGPLAHARATPLGRRRQLHVRHRRNPRLAGRPGDDFRTRPRRARLNFAGAHFVPLVYPVRASCWRSSLCSLRALQSLC